jgi:putative Ca2+/H+ antiporter (TMEM165/GDT1 family)
MDWTLFATIFGSVFLAELGDKTQLATMLFASKAEISKLQVFAAASLALVFATGLGVVAGQLIGTWVSERVLRWIAGLGFVGIGIWTLFRA